MTSVQPAEALVAQAIHVVAGIALVERCCLDDLDVLRAVEEPGVRGNSQEGWTRSSPSPVSGYR
jgi:hypothetical protein